MDIIGDVGMCPQPREHVLESSHLDQGQTKNEMTKVFLQLLLLLLRRGFDRNKTRDDVHKTVVMMVLMVDGHEDLYWPARKNGSNRHFYSDGWGVDGAFLGFLLWDIQERKGKKY